jgi:hypothetical protein
MFFVFVLFVALVATLGSDFLPMTNDVPIFIRDIPPRERFDAIRAGKDQADKALALPAVQLTRSTKHDRSLKLEIMCVCVTRHLT